jgi:hypothetical protein
MEEQIPHGLPEFCDVLGSWRPDFLVGEGTGGGLYPSAETFCLTEINARFCFNGFMHEAYGQQALLHLGVEGRGLYGATDPAKVRAAAPEFYTVRAGLLTRQAIDSWRAV